MFETSKETSNVQVSRPQSLDSWCFQSTGFPDQWWLHRKTQLDAYVPCVCMHRDYCSTEIQILCVRCMYVHVLCMHVEVRSGVTHLPLLLSILFQCHFWQRRLLNNVFFIIHTHPPYPVSSQIHFTTELCVLYFFFPLLIETSLRHLGTLGCMAFFPRLRGHWGRGDRKSLRAGGSRWMQGNGVLGTQQGSCM